jgi:hypothetical protein
VCARVRACVCACACVCVFKCCACDCVDGFGGCRCTFIEDAGRMAFQWNVQATHVSNEWKADPWVGNSFVAFNLLFQVFPCAVLLINGAVSVRHASLLHFCISAISSVSRFRLFLIGWLVLESTLAPFPFHSYTFDCGMPLRSRNVYRVQLQKQRTLLLITSQPISK